MLYWPWLLTIAYSVTLCLDPFIPFYLYKHLQLNTTTISTLLSITYTFRLISGIWPALVNSRPDLYGKTITLLIILSSFCYVPLLMLIKNDNDQTEWKWALLLLCSIVNGLFYQPLGILINSAIIKILGDFRVLFYGSYLRWGDAIRVVVIGLIGLVASKSNEDSFGTILLGVWIVGAMLLCVFALSKSNAVVPANLDQLNIREDQAPLLLKSALKLTVDQSSIYYAVYKPYSIFGEQLSHISEEDASLLDRVMTTEDSLRQMYSYVSNVPSFYSRRITTNDGLVQYRSQNIEQWEAYEEEEHRTFHAYALALLPLPTSTDPLVALLSNPEDEEAEEELFPRTSYYYQPQNNPHLMKLKNWKLKALSVTILLVGITKALLNTFLFIYSSSVLGISVTDIACLIMVQLTSEAMVHFIIEKWFIHKLNLGLITMLAHITTILCPIVYSCLGPNSTVTRPILILLQILQTIAFQSIWSSAVDQIHIIVWNQYERMKERSKISALYSSFGSALGATIAGIVLQYDLNNYSFLFKVSIVFSALSFVISWGWTSDD